MGDHLDKMVSVRRIYSQPVLSPQRGEEDRWGKGGDEIIEMCTLDIEAMYPALKREYIIEQIDARLWGRIERAQGLEAKSQAVKMRELLMPMLIFTLEHQFVYILSEGETEEKVFYYQKQGIGIGSSASGAIANLTLLAGEYDMIDRMKAGGLRIMLYKRYIDDIYCISVRKEGEIAGGGMMQRLERELNSLDPVGNSVKVEGKGVEMGRGRGKEGDKVELEFLDVLVGLEKGKNGEGVSLNTRVYRKPSASDLYLLPSSAHPPEVSVEVEVLQVHGAGGGGVSGVHGAGGCAGGARGGGGAVGAW